MFDADSHACIHSGKVSDKKPKDGKKSTAATLSKMSANKQARALAVS
jgi:hypothetical protein